MTLSPPEQVLFDVYAADYDGALQRGLSVSGEDKLFFARGRIAWLARRLHALAFSPRSVVDFGCGTGASIPLLFELLGVESVTGVDVSRQSLNVAQSQVDRATTRFFLPEEYAPAGDVDLVFCNGVFHHIPPAERAATIHYLHDALQPGGIFAFWENNPFNPGTRYVMSRIPFDRDALCLTGREACTLLAAGGFEILSLDYQFIFPRVLRFLRPLEQWLSRLPLGAQYQVLCRKPV